MKAKVRKSLNLLLQIAIILAAYAFLYKQVIQKTDIDEVILALEQKLSNASFITYSTTAFLLMFLNLGVEAKKWKLLIGKYEYVPFFKAFKAVFSGVTVSVFTPNRIGEYFGRVFILKHLHPLKGVLITFIGSMGQLLATILIGSISSLIFIPRILDVFIFQNHLLFIGIIIATLIILALLVLLYLNFSVISLFSRKLIPGANEKLDKYIDVFEAYNSTDLLKILLLSLARYMIFTTQFILLLLAYGIKIPFMHYLTVIPVIFLVMTIIPTIALSELGIRGSVSLYFLGFYLTETVGLYDLSSLGIVAASTTLWLFNLAIPALTGTFFVFSLRFIRGKLNNSES